MKTKKTVTLKGFLIQYSWSSDLMLTNERSLEQGCELFHREIEMKIPISTLAFDPADEEARKRAHDVNQIQALEVKKARLCKEINDIEGEIQSLLALPQGV